MKKAIWRSPLPLLANALALASFCLSPSLAAQDSPTQRCRQWIDQNTNAWTECYHWLHTHPELSLQEKETSEFLADLWEKAGYTVTRHVGGYGIVGILSNGTGPCVMLRTDLDALPVDERTGLPYASTVKATTQDGTPSGVMHACGHDLHMTNLTAVASFLAEHKSLWRGTLMLVGQPAEERGLGAKAMLDDGLFTRFPKPDYALALHVESATPAGQVGLRPGFLFANVDSVDIIVRGKGGHGAAPESTIDPIAQAAELILSLQTIVSREIKPTEPAVITVGSIHAGTKHNIISDQCHLQLTVRSYSPAIRQQLLDAITRRAKGIALTWNAPEPSITFSDGTPALENHAPLTRRLQATFHQALGSENVLEVNPFMGGEDFSQYGLAGVPIMMYRLGVIAPHRLQRFQQLGIQPPSLHSPEFYPDIESALPTGILSMSMAVLDLLPK